MKYLGQLIFAVIVFGALFGDVNWSPAWDVVNRVVDIVSSMVEVRIDQPESSCPDVVVPDESGTKMEWMG